MRTDQTRSKPLLAWDVIETRPGPYLPYLIAAAVWWLAPVLVAINVYRKGIQDDAVWVVIAFFVMLWVMLLLTGLRNRRAWRVINEGRARQPTEPWSWEYPWPRELLPDRARSNRAGILAFVIPAFAILVVTNGFMYVDGVFDSHPTRMLLINGAAILLLGSFLYLVAQGAKYRGIKLRLPHFPLLVGESTTVMLEHADQLRHAEEVKVRLRCVEQRTSHGATSNSVRQMIDELFGMDIEYRHGEPLSFTIPADAPGTQMLGRPPVMWELAVDAKVPGIDYRGRFLLPIYQRSDARVPDQLPARQSPSAT